MPIFGGWLRNVEDEQMQATFAYNKRLAQRAEQIGYDITLLAELNLNDIKGAVDERNSTGLQTAGDHGQDVRQHRSNF
jgi:hypothetical protein